jgi:hypothetical protein
MVEKAISTQNGANEKPALSSSDEFLHNAVTTLVLFTALMGFFVKKPSRNAERHVSNALDVAIKESSSAVNKPAPNYAPTASVVEPLTTHLHENSQEYKASHLESQSGQSVKVRSGILDAINDNSKMLNASTAETHLRILGLTDKDYTAVEIVEAYKRKAMQCNPEMFEKNDPKRRPNEIEFEGARNSFRLLMKYKEHLSRQKAAK